MTLSLGLQISPRLFQYLRYNACRQRCYWGALDKADCVRSRLANLQSFVLSQSIKMLLPSPAVQPKASTQILAREVDFAVFGA